ncbi:MAG: hypothetical protein K6F53_03310 [Lachnospiraceae bacterium]|nr:hypothetical protein [Lachnospiraceae bacterium]
MMKKVLTVIAAMATVIAMGITSLADSGVKCEAGDENYIRMALLAGGAYCEAGYVIPIENFVRADCSANPFYQQTKAALFQSVSRNSSEVYISLPVTTYADSQETLRSYNNIVRNLAIDLMKSKTLANVDFMLVPDDGCGHIGYGYTVRVWVSVNYHELTNEVIAEHPEIKGYYTEDCTTAYFKKHGITIY